MKQVFKAAGGLPGLALIVIGIIFMTVVGCGGEDPLEPMEMEDAVAMDVFGATKKAPDTAPAAPAAVPEGTPTVKSVGYYIDWKLTEPLTGTVAPGTTIFVKVVFSEAVQHRVADENSAGKPILYYRLGKQEQVRFRIAGHGAGGENFVSGNAKPFGSGTDDFVCKYTVPADATGSFRVEVGKFNADLEGNNLPAYYVHGEQLQFGQPTETEPEPDPEEETEVVEVPEGTPTVKEVGYYKDWKLTEPLTDIVDPGTKFFVKVVFSEPMKLHPADDDTARPIVYYRIGNRRLRFNIAAHGASGEDFVHGDMKPFGGGTDDFVGKVTMPEDATESFRIEVGKGSADLEGNTLPEIYIHTEELQLGRAVEPEPEPTEPETPAVPTDTTPPTVVSIEHYRGDALLADGESVDPGTTIDTKIVFSEPVVPAVTYTTGAQGRARPYTVSEQGGVHWRNLCKPTDSTRTTWLCRQDAAMPSFTVTVTTNTADLAGNRLAEAVVAPVLPTEPPPTGDPFSGRVYIPGAVSELARKSSLPVSGATVTIISGSQAGSRATTNQSGEYTFPNIAEDALRVRVTKSGFETKEVVVYRHHPTTINGRASSHQGDPQNSPGNIVFGHAWPDQMRPILQKLTVEHDLLYVERSIGGNVLEEFGGGQSIGSTGSGYVVVDRSAIERLGLGEDGVLFVCAHELFHKHQRGMVIASGKSGNVAGQEATEEWHYTTAEGKAFVEARNKDWAEVGKAEYDTMYTIPLIFESAADTFAAWWGLKTGQWSLRFIENLKQDAPNRWQWAEKHFGHIVR